MDKREIRQMMELLQIEDVTTKRQLKNGTITWRLPIKIGSGNRNIEVGSFKSGYVRNNNCGYSNYQLNKRCEGEPEYFQLANGDYRRFSTRSCVLIQKEIDRLEYLIRYCLKNYYIKHANFVADGEYVPKWKFDNAISSSNNDFNGHRDRIRDLEEDLKNMTEARDYYKNSFDDLQDEDYRVKNLENKLQSIIRTARH